MPRMTRAGQHVGADARPAPAIPLRVRVGLAIRHHREAAGFPSQEAYADAAGVHRTYAGKVERGELNISLDSLERLARPLGLTPGELLIAAERISTG